MPFLKMITKSTKTTNIYCGELWIKQHFSAKIHQWNKKEQLHVHQNWAPTNTRRHHTKFSCYNYLASGICMSLPKNLNEYVITLLTFKIWYWKLGCVRSRMLNHWQWCQVWQPQMFLAGTSTSDLNSNLQVNPVFHTEFHQAQLTLEHRRQWFPGVKIIKTKTYNPKTSSLPTVILRIT